MTKVGDRVELEYTSDPYTKLKPGEQGEVFSIDAMGTVHVLWDGGSNLGLIPGVDRWKVISSKENSQN